MNKGDDRVYLEAHPLPADYAEFYASLSPIERELHEMAMKTDGERAVGGVGLGSSYFVERTRQYKAWSNAKEKASAKK